LAERTKPSRHEAQYNVFIHHLFYFFHHYFQLKKRLGTVMCKHRRENSAKRLFLARQYRAQTGMDE